MDTAPGNSEGEGLGQQEPEGAAAPPEPPRADAEQPAEPHDNRSGSQLPTTSERGWPFSAFTGWSVDKNVSATEAIGLVVALIGVILIARQIGQTNASLTLTREALTEAKNANAEADRSNQIANDALDDAREARKQDAVDAEVRTAREERLVVSAETSSQAARDSVEHQRLAIRQEQRAIVVAGTQRVIQEPTTEQPMLRIEIPWSNAGRTSGRNVKTRAGLQFASGTGATEVRNGNFTHADSASAIHPGVPFHSVIEYPFAPHELVAYLGRKASIVIFARLDYEDMFGASHWVTFCVFRDFGDERFKFCRSGNDFGTVGEARQ